MTDFYLTLKDVRAWIKDAEHVDTINSEFVEGTLYSDEIFKSGSEYFKIAFEDGRPALYECRNNVGVYKVTSVTRLTRIVEQVYYV